MNDEEILLDAAYIKLRNGEPMSLIDFRRIISLIERAPFLLNQFKDDELAGAQSEFIGVLQKKFMRGETQQ